MAKIYDVMKAARQYAINSLDAANIENTAKTVVLGNRIQGYKYHQLCLSIESFNRPSRLLDSIEVSFNCYAATMADNCAMAQSIMDNLTTSPYYVYPEPVDPPVEEDPGVKYTMTFVDLYQDAPDNDFFKTSVSIRFTAP